MIGYLFLIGFLLETLVAFNCSAEEPPIAIKAMLSSNGDTVFINAAMQKGWYCYGIEPKENSDGIGPQATAAIVEDELDAVKSDGIIAPKPITKFDEGFDMNIDTYSNAVLFKIPLAWKGGIRLKSPYVVKAGLYLQLCDGKTCLPPTDYTVELDIGEK